MCGVFRYNISAESPAKSTLSQGHGLSTGGGELYGQHIYIYVCMYVCIYVCMYVYTYVYMYIHMYICIYVYMYICIYVYMYKCINV